VENYDVLKDVSERTGGDIYLGVVGPVRTGKSTFIKRFMEELVLPNIEDLHERERALDEMPQSGSGRTVMTAEPKFIPAEAVNIRLGDGIEMRVRLVDCVGYPVAGAMGFEDEYGPRMVDTPWFDEPVSFEQAAEMGTAKVINEHSTIGIVVLTDGSFGPIPAEAFNEAATRSIEELQALGKPFIIIINSADPEGEAAQTMAVELAEQYGVTVIPLNLLQMDIDDITEILNSVLYEFPVTEVNVSLPRWIEELDSSHWLRKEMEDGVASAVQQVKKVRDIGHIKEVMDGLPDVRQVSLNQLALGQGTASYSVTPQDGLFFQVLAEYAGEEITGEHSILSMVRRYADGARRWNKISGAMDEVSLAGYGVVSPQLDELYLEEPELIKQGGHFGVRLRASAPSYHIV
jgi:stage IV sporulation protein A